MVDYYSDKGNLVHGQQAPEEVALITVFHNLNITLWNALERAFGSSADSASRVSSVEAPVELMLRDWR